MDTRTRLVLVVHAKELKRTTNTGRLAIKCLTNSEMRIRGENQSPQRLDLSDLLVGDYQSVLFYPSLEAEELNFEFVKKFSKPIQLIVPDGNWRQASKVSSRHPELQTIPHVKISKPNLAAHHLRAESSSIGMSTLEAIAEAFRITESEEVYSQLMAVYQAKLKKTLIGRGEKIDLGDASKIF